MNKFQKGDRVVTKSGTHGTVITVMDGNNYAVQFDGREVSKVHEGQMIAENAHACNAKFKVGDRVKMKQGGKTYTVIKPYMKDAYWCKDDIGIEATIREDQIVAANSIVSTNPVVNAALNGQTAYDKAYDERVKKDFQEVKKVMDQKFKQAGLILQQAQEECGQFIQHYELEEDPTPVIKSLIASARKRYAEVDKMMQYNPYRY